MYHMNKTEKARLRKRPSAGIERLILRKTVIHAKPEAMHFSAWFAGHSAASGELIKAIRTGLDFGQLSALQSRLDIPMEKLAAKLSMSRATLQRRKVQGRLDPTESDRVIRFARLVERAVEVMEGEQPARDWLTSPQVGLGGAVPLDYAETEVGAREVEDLLGRIEYGVYS